MASPIDVRARVTAGLAPLRGGSCSQDPPEKVPGDRRLYGDALTGRSEAAPSQLFEYLIACRQAGSRHIQRETTGGKRAVPLTRPVEKLLRLWLGERAGQTDDPLFPTRTGRRLSRDAVALRVKTHAAAAAQHCPSLHGKRIHPHVMRHSCAMSLLQAGVDTSVIALWLGHVGVRSTDAYLHADISIKEKALALTTPASARPGRYRPGSEGLAFVPYLEGERTPPLPTATGELVGMSLSNLAPANVARAAIEGVLWSLAFGLRVLQQHGEPIGRVILTGGAAQSAAVQQIAPAVFGLPVTVTAAARIDEQYSATIREHYQAPV